MTIMTYIIYALIRKRNDIYNICIFWCNDCYRVMIGRPPSFRAKVREIDLIACEMKSIGSFMHYEIYNEIDFGH